MKKKQIKTDEVKSKSMKQPINLTQEEAAIFQRIKAEGKEGRREWEEVTEESVLDFSLRRDPMMLPDFAKKLREAKKFAFVWVTRTKERLDEIRSMEIPHKWWIVNSSTMPECLEDLDPVLGCVCKLDQLLVFKPWWMHVAKRRMVEQGIESKARSGELQSKHGQAIDESGSEFVTGRQARIGSGRDEVQFHEVDANIDEGESLTPDKLFEPGDDELGDLTAED